MLYRLLERIDRDEVINSVVSLKSTHPLGDRIAALGIPVTGLGIDRLVWPPQLVRLRRALVASRPDVIQTWMLHANVIGGLTASLRPAPVVWGIHAPILDRASSGTTTVAMQRLEAKLSYILPARIVACSEAARAGMARLGYANGKVVVIPNGFDLRRFHPDAEARSSVRSELGIGGDRTLIGSIARFHPQKDPETLFKTVALLLPRFPELHVAVCGRGMTPSNPELSPLISGLGPRLHLLGEREDVPRIAAALDVAVSSSRVEALPLAVGEAMASGVPIATTSCGDTAALVGETGTVAPARNPPALAEAVAALLEMSTADRASLGRAARARVGRQYELSGVVSRYVDLWRSLAFGKTD
jgi:glycosyltransferase involved in cell wall biosynthesis